MKNPSTPWREGNPLRPVGQGTPQLATVGSMEGFGVKRQGENSKSPPPRRNGWATIRSQSSRNRPVRTRTPGGVGALAGAIPSGRPDWVFSRGSFNAPGFKISHFEDASFH
jgi:hypothetical protein